MIRSRPPARTLVLAVVALLVLGACGTSSNAPSANPGGGGGAASTAVGERAITVSHEGGELSLDEPATKVVALEWSYVEDLLALGVTPAGVADIDGYGQWVRAEPAIPEGVTDVGDRQEPSLEEIRLLAPDLIITASDRSVANLEELGDIAPVLTFNEYPEDGDHYQAMIDAFRSIATAVGREDEVDEVLAELDATIAEGAATLEEAGLAGTEIALSQGEGTPEAPMFRLFTDNAMVVDIATQMGLENAIEADDQEFGFVSVSLEGLTQVGDAWFLPVAPEDAMAEFEALYGDSPTWRSLEFVQQDRVAPLGQDTWFFGGPLSAELFVDRVVGALTQ